MRFSSGETVEILHPDTSSSDEYGDAATVTWSSEYVEGCAVWFPATDENNDRQSVVSASLAVALPPCTVVESSARMVVRDVTYEVVGEPADWRSPFTGWNPGVVVGLERAQ